MKTILTNTFPPLSRIKSKAFMLVEIMFALAIIGVIGIGLTSFMTDSAKSMLWSINKSRITNDFRLFTLQIGNDAINSDYVFLYPSFTPNDYDESDDRIESPLSGDFLVLVNTRPFPEVSSPRYYRSMTVYYRDPDTDGNSPVFRSEIEFNEGENLAEPDVLDSNFESFLLSQRDEIASKARPVLELANGLTDDQLFRLINNNQAFLINGEIIHGNNSQQVTNTYNLTISIRSLL